MPFVSVCMAAYNSKDTIEEAILSVLSQTHENFELIILDDCSDDGTFEIVKKYKDKRIRLYRNDFNIGYLLSFNKLLDSAKGEYITFLDSDDIILSDKLEQQLKVFDGCEDELGVVGTNFFRMDSEGRRFSFSSLPSDWPKIHSIMSEFPEVPVCGSSVMLRKCVLQDFGGYREYFNGMPGEDFDWIRRISSKYQIQNVKEALYGYRVAKGSLTRKVFDSIIPRYSADIAFLLHKQREQYGKDEIEVNSLSEVSEFIDNLKKEYRSHPSKLDRQCSLEHAINRDFDKAMKSAFNSIHAEPYEYRNYVLFFYIGVLLIFPLRFLVAIKEKLGLKNLSKGL